MSDEKKDEKTKTKNPHKSFATTMASESGGTLRVTALGRKDGTYTVFAVFYSGEVKDGKRIGQRGATSQHSDVEKATAQVNKVVEAAKARGWKVKTSGRKAAAVDAFDLNSIPRPPRAKQ